MSGFNPFFSPSAVMPGSHKNRTVSSPSVALIPKRTGNIWMHFSTGQPRRRYFRQEHLPVQCSSLTWLNVSCFEKMALGNQLKATLKKSTEWHPGLLSLCRDHRATEKTHVYIIISRQLMKNSSACIYEERRKPKQFCREKKFHYH